MCNLFKLYKNKRINTLPFQSQTDVLERSFDVVIRFSPLLVTQARGCKKVKSKMFTMWTYVVFVFLNCSCFEITFVTSTARLPQSLHQSELQLAVWVLWCGAHSHTNTSSVLLQYQELIQVYAHNTQTSLKWGTAIKATRTDHKVTEGSSSSSSSSRRGTTQM